jgi:hypothetical protein
MFVDTPHQATECSSESFLISPYSLLADAIVMGWLCLAQFWSGVVFALISRNLGGYHAERRPAGPSESNSFVTPGLVYVYEVV